jgi:hypothetical protein
MVVNKVWLWEIPVMETVKADNYKRVRLPDAKPGQVFAYDSQNGIITLTQVKKPEPEIAKSKLVKDADGFTVVVPAQPINEQAIKELLADFP